ncbi:MAG: substrate-binding domain-containing protein, partial [Pseudomonadota bacterium]
VHTERCRTLLAASGVPVVETWDRPARPIDKVVGFSNAAAGRQIAHHLYAEGRRRIGFIGGDSSRDTRGADRRRGFLQALEDLGVPRDRLVADGAPPITMREGASAMRRLIERWPDTEAVMCVSDLSAFGALSAARRLGLSVPGDIAIAGFGAYDISEFTDPGITTVDARAHAIGLKSAEVILAALSHPEAARRGAADPNDVIEIETALIVRGSTRLQPG